MKRRDFVKRISGTLIAIPIGATLFRCGDGDGGSAVDAGNGPPDAAGLACSESVATNHGHTVEVPEADVEAGLEKTYNLTLGGDHFHTLFLSAANMASLSGGGSVTVESSIDPSTSFGTHAHDVTVTCQ